MRSLASSAMAYPVITIAVAAVAERLFSRRMTLVADPGRSRATLISQESASIPCRADLLNGDMDLAMARERRFCSEAEADAAGWRRSKV